MGRKDRPSGGFFTSGLPEKTIRTTVYIDGYNLYYGRLRHSGHKWLDVVQLFERLVKIQDPSSDVLTVKFFTAPAKEAFASQGKASVVAQQTYHRALVARHPERFSIILGTHTFDKKGALLPRFEEGAKYDKSDRVRVWALEEKKTDVNLALAMYRDCCRGMNDQVVLCSNDSDAEPALEALREDFPSVRIGVITPVPPQLAGHPARRLSVSLSRHADWSRQHITDAELAAAQLPARVPTKNKPADKPAHWQVSQESS